MNEQINSVDFWVEELTHDINPEHFNHHENFIPYMHDEKISSFGNWMWNNGYNVGLANLQTKVNTYCVPQWVSVKDRLPEPKKDILVYSEIEHPHKIRVDFLKASGQWFNSFHVTHWCYLLEPPNE